MDREKLITRQHELIKTIEAIDEVLHSKAWQVLRGTFEELAEKLERQLLVESKSPDVNIKNIYILQGQLITAKRYDLATYAEEKKKELAGIKYNLQ